MSHAMPMSILGSRLCCPHFHWFTGVADLHTSFASTVALFFSSLFVFGANCCFTYVGIPPGIFCANLL